MKPECAFKMKFWSHTSFHTVTRESCPGGCGLRGHLPWACKPPRCVHLPWETQVLQLSCPCLASRSLLGCVCVGRRHPQAPTCMLRCQAHSLLLTTSVPSLGTGSPQLCLAWERSCCWQGDLEAASRVLTAGLIPSSLSPQVQMFSFLSCFLSSQVLPPPRFFPPEKVSV